MLDLFFGNDLSALTTAAILAMFAFMTITLMKRNQIQKWGRLILLFVVIGTAISGGLV